MVWNMEYIATPEGLWTKMVLYLSIDPLATLKSDSTQLLAAIINPESCNWGCSTWGSSTRGWGNDSTWATTCIIIIIIIIIITIIIIILIIIIISCKTKLKLNNPLRLSSSWLNHGVETYYYWWQHSESSRQVVRANLKNATSEARIENTWLSYWQSTICRYVNVHI